MKKIIAFITAALMAMSIVVPAMAADAGLQTLANPSEDRGTITVNMKTSNGTPVPGGELALYWVADVHADNSGYHFYYRDGYTGLKDQYDVEKNEAFQEQLDEKAADIAKDIKDYIDKNSDIKPLQTVEVDKNGVAKFKGDEEEEKTGLPVGLEDGIYLIVQTQAASGYQKVNPFLVTLPYLQDKESGALSFKITVDPFDPVANPKVEPVNPVTPGPGPGPGPTTTPSPSPTVSPTPTETPSPTVTPTATPTPTGSPVPTKKVTPTLTAKPGRTVVTHKTVTTTKTTNPTVTKASVLPQTGQLWWPVWVLAAAGAVLLVSGMVRKKRS